MSHPDGPVLVLGIGNILLGDEGVGVRAVEALAAAAGHGTPISHDVRIVDGGTLGLDLLPLVEDARALVLVDAIDAGADPGTVVVLHGAELTARLSGGVSVHQVGVGDLVAVARLRGTLPEQTTLVGVQPASVDVGISLSPPVAAALPTLVDTVTAEIAALAAAPGMASPAS
jgi:hydrogenase maturation protease